MTTHFDLVSVMLRLLPFVQSRSGTGLGLLGGNGSALGLGGGLLFRCADGEHWAGSIAYDLVGLGPRRLCS
jgi:hypothetical protein